MAIRSVLTVFHHPLCYTLITGILLYCLEAVLSCHAQIPPQSNPVLLTPTPVPQVIGDPAPPVKVHIIREAPSLPKETPEANDDDITSDNNDIQQLLKGYIVEPTRRSAQPTPSSAETIGEVTIVGNRFFRTSFITAQIGLKPNQPLNTACLEKTLNSINKANGYHITEAILTPNPNTGKIDITFKIAERQPWQMTPTFDNQGRPYVGFYRAGYQITNQNLLGIGDRLSAQYFNGSGTNAVSTSYTIPIDKRGDEIGYYFIYNHADASIIPSQGHNEIDAYSANFGPTLTIPITRDKRWVATSSFDMRRNGIYVNDNHVSQVNTAFFFMGLAYNKADPWGRTVASYRAAMGEASFDRGHVLFGHNVQLTRTLNLPWHNQLVLRSQLFYAPNRLPLSQLIRVGGAYSVRGYTESLLLGERGYTCNIEDYWPIPFLHHVSPWLDSRLRGVAFFDIGQAWIDHSDPRYRPGVSNKAVNNLLTSTGMGVRMKLTQYLQGFLDLGVGLVDRNRLEPTGQPTVRVHFGLSSNLLPELFKPRTR